MRRSKKSSVINSILIGLLILIIPITIAAGYGIYNKVVKKATVINDYTLIAKALLGMERRKDFLILFMNNAEARYGGGFIGSVGYISVNQGKITADPVRSVYYYDHKYDQIKYMDNSAHPRYEDLGYLNLRNSGRNIDWPLNGERAKKIFEKESGKNVDFVVGITPEVLKFLLDYTGPIKLEDYNNKIISKENIIDELQTEVEYGVDKISGKDPKSILNSIANKIINYMTARNLNELEKIVKDMAKLLDGKQIVLYSSESDVQEKFEAVKVAGNLEKFSGDYLQISEDNTSIDKSSAFIDREVIKNIKILESGESEISIEIKRTQNRVKSIEYIEPSNGTLTYLIKENRSDVRLAIPKGSVIINDQTTTALRPIGNEESVDIYEFQSHLEPLQPANYKIKYKLPFRAAIVNQELFSVDSLIQLQNGGWPFKLVQTIEVPSSWKLVASNKKDLIEKDSMTIYDKLITKDELTSFVYAKE